MYDYDYFIDPRWNFTNMLQLPEFSDSLINYTPKALEMMAADPDDLKISVEEVLSGTQARKMFHCRKADFAFDPVAGEYRLLHSCERALTMLSCPLPLVLLTGSRAVRRLHACTLARCHVCSGRSVFLYVRWPLVALLLACCRPPACIHFRSLRCVQSACTHCRIRGCSLLLYVCCVFAVSLALS